MIKILAIGNSFSEDAAAYLHSIAQSDGVDLMVVNLYIGGSSLKTHWFHAANDNHAFEYQLNGKSTDRMVSIHEILLEESWDFITFQQASHHSGFIETYFPYIKDLSTFVTSYAPQAKQYIHQTWAYEIDSDHSHFPRYNNDQHEMYELLTKAYDYGSKELSLPLIPSGTVIQALRAHPVFDYSTGGLSLCRDGFHMHLLYGRYAVAATWYQCLVGKSILENHFIPPIIYGMKANPMYLEIIKKQVHELSDNGIYGNTI